MLANGTLLAVKLPGKEDFEVLPDIKTIPNMNNEKEQVENTPLSATNKRYEPGIGDYGDMVYTFVHTANTPDSSYRMIREHATRQTTLEFKEIWTDGTEFSYKAIPSVGFIRGGGSNTVVDLQVKMSLQSDIIVKDPD